MLTSRQKQLLEFIDARIKETGGISPSFDEMKEALNLASKSGIHRLVSSLEERGFLKRLPNRARTLEVVKRPETSLDERINRTKPLKIVDSSPMPPDAGLPIMGRIAAGIPASAIETEISRIPSPIANLDQDTHFALEVQGDSMINAGIHDGDTAIFQKCNDATSGNIVLALIDETEATLKRLRKHKARIALEAANPSYETRIFGPGRIRIQGKLAALVRKYP